MIMAKLKLDAKQIAEIKELYKNGGVTHAELAESYDVGIATIRRILAGVKGKDTATAVVSKTVNKLLSVDEEIELMQKKMAELELKKQAAYEARYLELGKWADEFIGNDDFNDYVIIRKSDLDDEDDEVDNNEVDNKAEVNKTDSEDVNDKLQSDDTDPDDSSTEDVKSDDQDSSFDGDTSVPDFY